MVFYPLGYAPIVRSKDAKTLDKEALASNPFSRVSFSQLGEDLILERLLTRSLGLDIDKYKGTYIDVGAYHPHSHSTTYLLYERGWSGIAIDMSEGTCRLYRELRPRDIVLNVAAADHEGKTMGYFANEISLRNTINSDDLAEWVDYVEREVTVRRLDGILSEYPEIEKIDYLNIDAEGAEISVLEGLNFNVWRPNLITVEIHGSSVEEAIKSDISNYLTSRDYIMMAGSVITYFFVDQRAIVRQKSGPKASA